MYKNEVWLPEADYLENVDDHECLTSLESFSDDYLPEDGELKNQDEECSPVNDTEDARKSGVYLQEAADLENLGKKGQMDCSEEICEMGISSPETSDLENLKDQGYQSSHSPGLHQSDTGAHSRKSATAAPPLIMQKGWS
ncbi:uncharacterized protein O3C94_004921 [Discoglossus pictus]